MHDRLDRRYPVNNSGESFKKLVQKIRRAGRNKKYDAAVGVSGGRDSIYALYILKKAGLRPLGVHLDTGWVSEIAQRNMKNASQKLGVDIIEEEFDEIKVRNMFKACLKASVPDTCLPCSIGKGSAIYQAAVKYNIEYVIISISFRTEGVNPLKENYCDGLYFDHIMKEFNGPNVKNFNRMRAMDFVNYIFLKRIKIIQLPFYLYDYDHEKIDGILKKEVNWAYGGKHHFDCRYKALVSYVKFHKFGFDDRRIYLSAQVRSGHMTREEALKELEKIPEYDENLKRCLKELNMDIEEFNEIMAQKVKYFHNYPNYYSLFDHFKPFFKMLSKLNLLPETIYEKLFDGAEKSKI
jgi:tRNA(Ile)-lysidine synthase TilS/MesJ